MKKIVISQPRYLPAINYLNRLYFADLFVFLDNVQRQGRGWENRNKILINGKERWLTIPISSSSRCLIKEAKIFGQDWLNLHKNLIHTAYCKHPFYNKKIVDNYYSGIKGVSENSTLSFSQTVIRLVLNACQIFGFKPKITLASNFPAADQHKGVKKLLKICREVRATVYISGVNGREYGVKETFKNSAVKVLFHDYHYPVYKQYGQSQFHPWLSFFDPLFNLGLDEVKKIIYRKPELLKK